MPFRLGETRGSGCMSAGTASRGGGAQRACTQAARAAAEAARCRQLARPVFCVRSLLPSHPAAAVTLQPGRAHVFEVWDADESLKPIGQVRWEHQPQAPAVAAAPLARRVPFRRTCATAAASGHAWPQVRAVQGGWGLAKLRLKEAMAAIREERPLLVGDLEVRALGGTAQCCGVCGRGAGGRCRACPQCRPSVSLPCLPGAQAGTGYAEIWPQRPAWWPGDWGHEAPFEEEQQRKAA